MSTADNYMGLTVLLRTETKEAQEVGDKEEMAAPYPPLKIDSLMISVVSAKKICII